MRKKAPRREYDDATYLDAWHAYYKAVVDAGTCTGAYLLDAPETGTTVQRRDGRPLMRDGPYASSKEQLGGSMLLKLPSRDAALEWAARCPATSYGAVEIRPG